MAKYLFERHFDGDDRKNAILAPLVDCHDQGRTVPGEQNKHNCSFNNAEQCSMDVSFITFYSIAKSRRRVHFRAMTLGFLSSRWILIASQSAFFKKIKKAEI